MGDTPRGFWAAAAADPDRVAVIDPGGEWTAGAILDGANQLVHGLRALGLGEGDPVATLLPNRAELIQVLLAVFQAGFQYVPINSNLTAAEAGYILTDSGAKVVIADERFADVAIAAAAEASEADGLSPALQDASTSRKNTASGAVRRRMRVTSVQAMAVAVDSPPQPAESTRRQGYRRPATGRRRARPG